MDTAYLVVITVTAAANLGAAAADFARPKWLQANMTRAGVPRSWVLPLGAIKVAGALGLLAGLAVPPIGLAAATGLVLYFVCATITIARARWYANLPLPASFLLLAVGSLVVQAAA